MKAFGDMFYVVHGTIDREEELAPFKGIGICRIAKPSLIEEVSLRWVGYGNEGRGRWTEDKLGEHVLCSIPIPGRKEPIYLNCDLAHLDNHLYATYEEAYKELHP